MPAVKLHSIMATAKLIATLDDAEGDGRSEVTIEITDEAIVITPLGYGDHNSDDGKGVPILFEFRHGVPHVAIWADINREDSTHVISLHDAKEDKRKENGH